MNWQPILRNQWFQLCLVAAVCSAGAGLFDLATIPGKQPPPTLLPTPYITPRPSAAPVAAVVQLHAKKSGHWIVDASGAADSDSRDLYQVVGSAVSGDTITIRPGRYEASLVINKDLALVGEGIAPANPLVFFNRDQFNVVDVEGGHVTFSNLRIEQDFNTTFAAFYCGKQARVEVANCSVTSKSTNNVSVADDAQLDVRDSFFRSSEVGYGMLFLGRAHGTVTHSNFIGNRIGLEAQNQSQRQSR